MTILTSKFPLRSGYFGSRGSSSTVRRIEADDPVTTALDFYRTAANGGIEIPLGNGRGVKSELSDGTKITMRLVSSSDGSPAVDINISKSDDPAGVKQQKIHFIRRHHEDN